MLKLMKTALLWSLYGAAILLGYEANCAPVHDNYLKQTEVNLHSSYFAENGSDVQDELRRTLLEGMFSNDSNNRTIQKSFASDTSKICIPITFHITCTAQEQCGPGETDHGCSSGISSTIVWTEFNTTRLSGKVIFYFASMDSTMPVIPGFDWSGACGTKYMYNASNDNYTLSTENAPVLIVMVNSLPCTIADGSDLFDALQYLTTLVSPVGITNINTNRQ